MKSFKAWVPVSLFVLCVAPLANAGSLIQSRFSYLTNTPEIHYQVTTNSKSIVSATLLVVDVGDVAPAGFEVASAELISQSNRASTFTFSKPDNGWPIGEYKIVVKDDGRVIDSVVFNVIPASDAVTEMGDADSGNQPAYPSGTTNYSAGQQGMSGGVIAQGTGGQLTSDAANAYVDALIFVHAQMGQPRNFSAAERQTIVSNLANSYASLPFDTQTDLSQARQILNEYQSSWNYIGLQEQKDFAYSVLSIAYGERAAAQALGMNSGGGSSSGGGGSSYYSDGASYVSDGNCAIFSSEYGSVSSCD
ncbi:hypothetical protein [Litoribrevibacter albus]|uniref:Uncharacterized protein n=1 Tax=Litoribrevibacter albus TaxID=1473156 RepID=A0AA37S8Y6_9GAMM|nr:hypothetical protein [Litoribrevibacter albus]GLQ30272.1 hypothetical protein GCM10007876_07500 [Litoribrevibacter albus]